MLKQLNQKAHVVGAKQTKRAVEGGNAQRVFLTEDADPRVTEPLEALCSGKDVPVTKVPSMKELGAACGISVGASVAALLRG